jgi:hypothetical protein
MTETVSNFRNYGIKSELMPPFVLSNVILKEEHRYRMSDDNEVLRGGEIAGRWKECVMWDFVTSSVHRRL